LLGQSGIKLFKSSDYHFIGINICGISHATQLLQE
jgi:hypothetical protein